MNMHEQDVPETARSERGMATTEFAVGTVGVIGIGGLLTWLTDLGVFDELLRTFFRIGLGFGIDPATWTDRWPL
ncbi:MAG: DUF4244 domain-containing protein [Aeromicrobium sp.]|uniref:DUF4244 domain-containing protein n=1 Tax=Aeromicrobium sp. TaxID=1871063 RepID=UPI0039E38037